MTEPESRVRRLFAAYHGSRATRVESVSPDASARRYWRLWGGEGETVIGAHGPEPEENRAFLSFSRTFRELGLPVPEIYDADEEAGVWLAEDLGNRTLFDIVTAAREAGGESREPATREAPDSAAGDRRDAFPASVVPLYERVLEWLPRFQVEGGRAIDFDAAYPRAAFDRQSILWDLNYFKYHFLKLAHVPFSEARLERDFGRLARFLMAAPSDCFLYRDFQSRNVMIRDGEPWFIDYQGGRKGALQYDPASLLYDAKADLSRELRSRLLEGYLEELERHAPVDRDDFLGRYPGFVLVRLMQAMGAYGYRGFYERKPHFLQSVPYAARTLGRLVEEGLPLRVSELEAVFRRIAEAWAHRDPERWTEWPELAWGPRPEPDAGARVAGSADPARSVRPPTAARGASAETRASRADEEALTTPTDQEPPITVRVASFSFRRGYPPDETGHGGPIFDCRVLPNPGRLEAYREATGLDEATVAFLEAREETGSFWELVRPLAEAQVREFLDRGHAELTIHFGCTGGQHRSPYFAERLSRHLREAFPGIRVEVLHRERHAWPGNGSEAEAVPTPG